MKSYSSLLPHIDNSSKFISSKPTSILLPDLIQFDSPTSSCSPEKNLQTAALLYAPNPHTKLSRSSRKLVLSIPVVYQLFWQISLRCQYSILLPTDTKSLMAVQVIHSFSASLRTLTTSSQVLLVKNSCASIVLTVSLISCNLSRSCSSARQMGSVPLMIEQMVSLRQIKRYSSAFSLNNTSLTILWSSILPPSLLFIFVSSPMISSWMLSTNPQKFSNFFSLKLKLSRIENQLSNDRQRLSYSQYSGETQRCISAFHLLTVLSVFNRRKFSIPDYKKLVLPTLSAPITNVRLSPMTLPPVTAELRNQTKKLSSSEYQCILRVILSLGLCCISKKKEDSTSESCCPLKI